MADLNTCLTKIVSTRDEFKIVKNI